MLAVSLRLRFVYCGRGTPPLVELCFICQMWLCLVSVIVEHPSCEGLALSTAQVVGALHQGCVQLLVLEKFEVGSS